MKKSFLITCSMLSFLCTSIAQDKSYKISYDFNLTSGINFDDAELDIELPEEIKQQLQNLKSLKEYELLIHENKSLYVSAPTKTPKKSDNVDDLMNGNQPQIFFQSLDNSNETVFTDFGTNEHILQQTIDGRNYIIKKPINKSDQEWKITNKQKEILGYNCQEAILANTSDTVVAYFAPSLSGPFGPLVYNGLPGIILEMNIGSNLHIIANHVEELSDKKTIQKITAPSKGKKVSPEEFEKIQSKFFEQLAENQESSGGGVQFKVIQR